MSKRVDEVEGEFLIFEFTDDPGKLVLDAAEAKAKQEEIGKAYGIVEPRRL